jgi:arginyl-tRNA synthetase
MMNDERHGVIAVTDELSSWMKDAFEAKFGDSGIDLSTIRVVEAGNREFGDYQCNDAMPLAKQLKNNPRKIAETVLDGLELHEGIEKAEIAGAGFINLTMKSEWLSGLLEQMISSEDLCVSQTGKGSTIVLDYGSPNITKPLHVGHLRSHNIGSAIDRMHRFLGYKVIADNHLGDWGTQFGITILGFKHFGDEAALTNEPMEELERVYVESYEKTKTDEDWLEQCRKELVKLQAGDKETLALWQRFIDLSIAEIEGIYKRIGVSYDTVRGESHYNDKLPGTVKELQDKGLAKESEGAQVVFLEDEKLPVCLVQKSDGGFNYATSDLATVASRVKEYDPDKIVYVTDERQQLHFRQVFAISRRLGCEAGLDHVWFGLMKGADGVFSTREGNVIKLSDLLDEAEARALKIVANSSTDMDAEQQKDVARMVGIGAVKYADLCQNPQSVVTFTWDKALALDGDSGPYLQYAHARIASVQDKYSERFPDVDLDSYRIELLEPIEKTLALKVLGFSDVVIRAAASYKPNSIAEYLYELAQAYSSFYQNVPFLKAEEGVRESRVRLCAAIAKVLKQGLDLLGIEAPSRI